MEGRRSRAYVEVEGVGHAEGPPRGEMEGGSKMRKFLMLVATALVVVMSAQAAVADSGAKYAPKIVYIGVFNPQPDQLSWTIRGVGVNSSYGVVLQVTFRSADGAEPVVVAPMTLKFSSGAGNTQWSTQHYSTTIPANAAVVGADVMLINLKKPTVPLDHRYVEKTFDGSYNGNLFCDPVFYPGSVC
jgi:hypothetical protein